MTEIVHLTSAHPRYDTRIFLKECSSLASAGYVLSLVVADGLPDEVKNGVHIIGLPKTSGRLQRVLFATKKMYKKVIDLDADIYHLHDPELIPLGLKLKRRGKKIIFDSHEDVAMQLRNKSYLNRCLRKIVSGLYAVFERYALKKFDLIVAATPFIRDKFAGWHANVADVNNFPILGELDNLESPKTRSGNIAYIGGITEVRGIREVVQSLDLCRNNVRLKLAGNFFSASFREELKTYPSWEKVDDLGFIDRMGIKELLSEVNLGLVTLLPAINYLDSLPVKMFEYMSTGLPVVASNFPLWKDIVEGNNCGICVDPTKPEEIAVAIDWILDHPKEAQEMGENGRKAVQEKYNWSMEERKLLKVYGDLLN